MKKKKIAKYDSSWQRTWAVVEGGDIIASEAAGHLFIFDTRAQARKNVRAKNETVVEVQSIHLKT